MNRAVSVDLETICLKCLEKHSAKRYPTAAALAEDLERYLNGEPIAARRVSRLERLLKWVARKPMTAAAYGLLAVTALLVLIGAAISSLWLEAERSRGEAVSAKIQAEKSRGEAVNAKRELERTKAYSQYVLNVRLAPTLWDSGWIADARQALENCPPHLRQWEWKYLHRAMHPELATMPAQTKRLFGLELTPDGKYLATCRENITIWDAADGQLVSSIPDLPPTIRSLRISPDGNWLASGADTRMSESPGDARDAMLVWNLKTKERVALWEQTAGVRATAFSDDGTRLVAGLRDGRLLLWNTAGLQPMPVFVRHPASVERMIFLAKSKRCVSSSSDGTLKVWDADSGRELGSIKVPRNATVLTSNRAGTEFAAFMLDGTVKWWDAETRRELASFSLNSGALDTQWADFDPHQRRIAVRSATRPNARIVDARSGKQLVEVAGLSGISRSVRFSPDGNRIVAGSDLGEIGLWSAATGEFLGSFTGHAAPVTVFEFSHDGARLYSGDLQGTAKIWDLTAPPPVAEFPKAAASPITAVSPDGYLAACAVEGNQVQVKNLLTGEEVAGSVVHEAAIYKLAFHPKRHWLASGDMKGFVRITDLASEKPPIAFKPHVGRVNQLRFNPSGDLLASAGQHGAIRLTNTASGKEVKTLHPDTHAVMNLAFDARGERLAAFGASGIVRIWNLSNDAEPRVLTWKVPLKANEFWLLEFSPNGRYLTSGWDKELMIWEADTGKLIKHIHDRHRITALAYSPDARHLAYGGYFPEVHIWDLPAVREIAKVGNTEYSALTFSPDGTRLVGGGLDYAIRLWDTSTWQEIAALKGHRQPATELRFDADGRRLVSVASDRTVRSWVAEETDAEKAERVSAAARLWRNKELAQAEAAQNWYALAFHLHWLRQQHSEDAALRTQQAQALEKLIDLGLEPPFAESKP
jgi:WD40 repeat protein